jgi:hypothetical protein
MVKDHACTAVGSLLFGTNADVCGGMLPCDSCGIGSTLSITIVTGYCMLPWCICSSVHAQYWSLVEVVGLFALL